MCYLGRERCGRGVTDGGPEMTHFYTSGCVSMGGDEKEVKSVPEEGDTLITCQNGVPDKARPSTTHLAYFAL